MTTLSAPVRVSSPRAGEGPPIVFGGAPLGNLFAEVSEEDALAVLQDAWAAGIREFDTAPLYGAGLSEERLGRFLEFGGADEAIVSTKVGRVLVPASESSSRKDGYLGHPFSAVHDFSAAGIARSLDGSLGRLGISRVDTVYLHDPDVHLAQVRDEAVPALLELRDQGLLLRIGVGTNSHEAALWCAENLPLDSLMVAGRLTLLDQRAEEGVLPASAARRLPVHAAGVFNSGILATGDAASPYFYREASTAVAAQTKRIREICDAHAVPIGAAAIQFPARYPEVERVVVGVRSRDELTSDLSWAAFPIPEAFWSSLFAVLRGEAAE